MLPITPNNYTRIISRNWYPQWYWITWVGKAVSVNGWRQTKPYNLDLPYQAVVYSASGPTDADSWAFDWVPYNRCISIATNQARAKFVAKLGDVQSVGATLTAERRETFGLIVSTTLRAAKAARLVAKFDLIGAAKVLGYPVKERVKRRVYYVRPHGPNGSSKRIVVKRVQISFPDKPKWHWKTAGSCWLWYSYGVKPLMETIYGCVDALQRPLAFEEKVQGYGRCEPTRLNWSSSTHQILEVRAKVSARVTVRNPNLYLANKLGLLNPVEWIVEAVPFSFVIDWFSNLSAFIGQMTDLEGFDLDRPLTTTRSTLTEDGSIGLSTQYRKTRFEFVRRMEIPTVKFVIAWERIEWQRGLNAISLLLGFLGKSPSH